MHCLVKAEHMRAFRKGASNLQVGRLDSGTSERLTREAQMGAHGPAGSPWRKGHSESLEDFP